MIISHPVESTETVKYTDRISADGVRPPSSECPEYDIKQSDGEATVMMEVWGMRFTPSLPSLPGPLWPEVVAPTYWSNTTV